MQTAKRTFNDLLAGSDKQLYCPPLQRPYEWGPQQWSDLYDDLRGAVASGEPHFFGTLILTEGVKDDNVTRHMLIDGQQRLTSLALLLSRGELELSSRPDRPYDCEFLLGSLQRVLRNKSKSAGLTWRVWPTEADQEDFGVAMSRGLPSKGSQIGKACRWFDNKFKSTEEFESTEDLARFLEKVLDTGVAVSIEMDNSDDVCAVFSSINGKGKPLNQIDLLKNIVMMRSGLPISEAHSKYWLPFEHELSRSDVASILRKMVLAEHGWCNASTTLDTLLRLPFAQKGCLPELHDKLMTWKRQHQYVAAGMPAGEFCRATAQVLKRTRLIAPLMQAQSLCLLEGLFLLHSQGKLGEEHLRNALTVIENYVLRTCLTDNQTTRDACKVTPEVLIREHADVPAFLAKALFQDNKTYRDAGDDRLEATVLRLRMDTKMRKSWAKAVLFRIDYAYNAEVEYSDPSLEHVMPQSLDGARQWNSDVPADTPHLLGNLTILHRPYNSDLGRASYAEKRMELGRSLVWLNQYFSTEAQWGPAEIDARTKALLREFFRIVPQN